MEVHVASALKEGIRRRGKKRNSTKRNLFSVSLKITSCMMIGKQETGRCSNKLWLGMKRSYGLIIRRIKQYSIDGGIRLIIKLIIIR